MSHAADCRHDPRVRVDLLVKTTTIDPVADPATHPRAYQLCDDDRVIDVSRRGICLRSYRPPEPGTRILLQMSLAQDPRPVDLVGRVRWTRVEIEPAKTAAPAIADVGVEVVGGSDHALRRFDEAYGLLIESQRQSVATPRTLG